jgi:hypothetical protein
LTNIGEFGTSTTSQRRMSKTRAGVRKKEKDKENINLLQFVAIFLDPRYKLSLYTKITIKEIQVISIHKDYH